ncbi:hypothetical protein [Commensalibacter nepenthis]|uniref:Uncharacterized protein n=1 Tax=Commensalibacter nepenthis TaxID=3043872 RepID=A0ABT6Q5N7_9PROT|nr:hypothetical protein [Commensalibacter sp. TBRC 10068]MDI2112213.1 hypothetical protein [Commensalibacter sp. TBRC 10068]
MKIMDEEGFISNVFGIYLSENNTLFWELSRGYRGLTAIDPKKDKVGIIDYNINFRAVYHRADIHGIFHWALIEENLLYDIIESEPGAFDRFLEIVKSEGLIDPELDEKIYNEYFPLY